MSDLERIVAFLKKHHVMTVATAVGGAPYCASVFYALLDDELQLVFSSSYSTRHGAEMQANSAVAGAIALETATVGKIQGLQFCGRVAEPADAMRARVRAAYLRRFPYAVVSSEPLWTLDFDFLKLTDNRLGFGKKIVWRRQL
jgi:uncharacterized protein YhbP (UPF0306 family)